MQGSGVRYIDAHNHLQDERLGPWRDAIVGECMAAGVAGMVVNGACESDWDAVEELARAHPGWALPSLGWHPWWLHEQAEGWEERLALRVAAAAGAGVGECGLDRWILEPGAAARLRAMPGRATAGACGMDQQVAVLRVHLRLASELDRPLSLHCLKAWGTLLEELRRGPLPRRGFLLHSFGGPAELVPELARMGAYFGFPGYFLHERKRRQAEVFRVVPADRLLTETDAPDQGLPAALQTHRLPDGGAGLNHPANLAAVGAGLARVLGVAEGELPRRLEENFSRWWFG